MVSPAAGAGYLANMRCAEGWGPQPCLRFPIRVGRLSAAAGRVAVGCRAGTGLGDLTGLPGARPSLQTSTQNGRNSIILRDPPGLVPEDGGWSSPEFEALVGQGRGVAGLLGHPVGTDLGPPGPRGGTVEIRGALKTSASVGHAQAGVPVELLGPSANSRWEVIAGCLGHSGGRAESRAARPGRCRRS